MMAIMLRSFTAREKVYLNSTHLLMTARRNATFWWLITAAALIVAASVALREQTKPSAAFFLLACAAAATNYFGAQATLASVVRVRTWLVPLLAIAAAGMAHFDHRALVIAALAALWAFLLGRFARPLPKIGTFVLFAGDFWLIVALSYLTVGWMLIAGLLALAISGAVIVDEARRWWPAALFWLCAAGLLLAGIGDYFRQFAIYLAATVALAAVNAVVTRACMARVASQSDQ
jgi:hypothetical protein